MIPIPATLQAGPPAAGRASRLPAALYSHVAAVLHTDDSDRPGRFPDRRPGHPSEQSRSAGPRGLPLSACRSDGAPRDAAPHLTADAPGARLATPAGTIGGSQGASAFANPACAARPARGGRAVGVSFPLRIVARPHTFTTCEASHADEP